MTEIKIDNRLLTPFCDVKNNMIGLFDNYVKYNLNIESFIEEILTHEILHLIIHKIRDGLKVTFHVDGLDMLLLKYIEQLYKIFISNDSINTRKLWMEIKIMFYRMFTNPSEWEE